MNIVYGDSWNLAWSFENRIACVIVDPYSLFALFACNIIVSDCYCDYNLPRSRLDADGVLSCKQSWFGLFIQDEGVVWRGSSPVSTAPVWSRN